jgi:hypothetical protein
MAPDLPYRWIISSSSRAARRPEIARLPYLRDMTPPMIALILALAVRLVARVVAAVVPFEKLAAGGGFKAVRARPLRFPAGSLPDPRQGKYLPCQPDQGKPCKALILREIIGPAAAFCGPKRKTSLFLGIGREVCGGGGSERAQHRAGGPLFKPGAGSRPPLSRGGDAKTTPSR